MFLLLATPQLGADLLGLVDERSRCGRIKSAAERVNLVDRGKGFEFHHQKRTGESLTVVLSGKVLTAPFHVHSNP